MSRPKLRPLSDLLPPKGAASRPEAVSLPTTNASPASKLESKLVSDLTSETQNLEAIEESRKQASMNEVQQTMSHSKTQDKEHVIKEAAEFREGPRSAVSFRMTERLQDRLREYAHQTRRTKQEILDEALHERLRRDGY